MSYNRNTLIARAGDFEVYDLPGLNASAVVSTFDSASVFREDENILPAHIGTDDDISYIPWGGDNQMPYRMLSLFEEDETLSACQGFISEVCYASGLRYEIPEGSPDPAGAALRLARPEVRGYFLDNDIPSCHLGTCKDLKYFDFAVTVLILDKAGGKITNIYRKEAAHCRFAEAHSDGYIPEVYYANWRLHGLTPDDVERIPLIDPRCPLTSLRRLVEYGHRKVGFVTRYPAVDSFYYPIPNYAALFRGKWYNIKKLIGVAKEAKLRNSAPIKYLIEISANYWRNLAEAEGITDPVKLKQRIVKAKQEILDFVSGSQNSGKALFSNFKTSPDGKAEMRDIRITKIENTPEGGDWASDHAEAINMLCFALRVHSNLVGSLPGKAQTNNSGSDKRELYTIAQAMQKPYHDIMSRLHRIIIAYNGWEPYEPKVPLIQLTTLDEHKDFKQVTADPSPDTATDEQRL